ncbi:TonB family protein [Qipengyuania marisflavi]|uniref:TonB family protein n=1 Tax=Qipengyuania marisflavi TaxID=2486356 RepID=A0A5S3P5N9_9SPHN|nr:TonB family protein [Qipengyuania marisflavi]TMM48141.1 TonB family protein [Qipengyuania marisflavi]
MLNTIKSIACTLVSSALTALPVAGQAADKPPVVLEPSSNWHLDYADQKCRLAREFGGGENPHILIMDQNSPSGSFALTAAGRSFGSFTGRSDLFLTFGAGAEAKEVKSYYKGQVDSYGAAVILTGISPYSGTPPESEAVNQETEEQDGLSQLDESAAAAIDHIAVSQKSRRIIFQTGSLAPAFAAMNVCTFDLVGSWGLDVEQHKTRSRPPRLLNIETISDRIRKNYPRAAEMMGEQGFIRARVIVDEAGSVTDCSQENATKLVLLESPTCQIMQGAKFEPALDAKGAPMRSYYTMNVAYKMR